jgi:hypothetical protein
MLWIFIVCLILAFMVVVNAHLKNYAKAVRKINMAKYMTKGWRPLKTKGVQGKQGSHFNHCKKNV